MKNKGFLLLELLIVALIIAILTSIMLPKYMKAIDKSKLNELGIAIDATNKDVESYNKKLAQMGIEGTIDLNKIEQQINQSVNYQINRQPTTYKNKNFSNSEEGSIMIKFED